MKSKFLKTSAIRNFIKSKNKRLGADFLAVLDAHIQLKIEQACAVHNGGAKTLNATIAGYIGLK